MELLRDPRIRTIEWKDALPLTAWEVAYELVIALPWLAGAVGAWHLAGAAHWGFGGLALGCSFFFFLTGLRQCHNAFHYTLGVSRRGCELVMFLLSPLMLSALHAVQVAHLNHHKHCLTDRDFEGVTAKMSAARALLYGPVFWLQLHIHAWRIARSRIRGVIALEVAAMASLVVAAFLSPLPLPVRAHVLTMVVAQCCTGFFAVWTVHHDCDRSNIFARTQRGWLKNFVSYDMFFHLEHHLFPGVPTRHLARIAERLDAVAPEVRAKQVY